MDKFGIVKDEVVKIGENKYVLLNNSYNVVINTTETVKNQSENIHILDFIEKYIGEFLQNN